MLKVPREQVDLAYERWCSVRGMNEVYTFWEFLGKEKGTHYNWGHYNVSEEGAKRLEMLLGPHYVALVKVYLLRNKKREPKNANNRKK